MSLELACAGVILLSMILYLLAGGADFGGGIWQLLAWGPRVGEQRRALDHAVAPIWEANHVWLIVVVVMLFVCFPQPFAVVMTALHIPIAAMLVGIVLRGSAYAFRSYAAGAKGLQRRASHVFAISSVVTPLMLGVVAGAVARGAIPLMHDRLDGYALFVAPWLAPFPFAIGAFTLALCGYLSAVYMTVEADTAALVDDFRRRAIGAAVAVGGCAAASAALAFRDAPRLFESLTSSGWAVGFHSITAAVAVAALLTLWKRRYRWARALAVAQTVLILLGWGLAQYPYVLAPHLTIYDSAAPPEALANSLVILGIGAVAVIPAFIYLYAVFKRQVHPSSSEP